MARVEIDADGLTIDAAIVGEALGIEAAQVPAAMRAGTLTSLHERGEGADAGRHRLTFFFGNRRLRLVVDVSGNIIQRSVVDFADRPLPASLHKPGG
jgi:hypothetical protein